VDPMHTFEMEPFPYDNPMEHWPAVVEDTVTIQTYILRYLGPDDERRGQTKEAAEWIRDSGIGRDRLRILYPDHSPYTGPIPAIYPEL
jgi:hypothetical protein